MSDGNKNKLISVVTGTRADFGLLRPVIRGIMDAGFPLRLIATGSHLVDSLGRTVSEIEESGFSVSREIDILLGNPGTPPDEAFARAFSGFSAEFREYPPGAAVVLGDRYEALAAALAAYMAGVPLAHISGGDVTEGAKDDGFRHCITKLSWLHFTSTERYRERVIQLGESPDRVFNVGALGAENILSLPAVPREELSRSAGFDFSGDFLLVTYHPETLGSGSPAEELEELLAALDDVDMPVLFTKANADAGGAEINARLAAYCAGRNDKKLADSLGAVRYLSAMRYARAVAGNSSSAVVEAPSLKVPAVNIGDRQTGRVLGKNVINCPARRGAIAAALRETVSNGFRESIKDMRSPYGGANVSGQIVSKLAEFLSGGEKGLKKRFYDIDFLTGGMRI